jgi:SAM-dependent methyltransferase
MHDHAIFNNSTENTSPEHLFLTFRYSTMALCMEEIMDPYSKEKLLSFYNFHLKKFGDRPEALRWTPHGQLRRYHMLADIAPPAELNNATLLDYGCGTGDFYRFLKRRDINVRYTGVDINENFIRLAKTKYPDCTFSVMNIDDDCLEGFYDYIVICGVFNLQVPGVDDDIKNALVNLFKHCNKGLAFNALSSHMPIKDPELHFTSPEEMVKFSIENLSPSVALRHDRIQNDFTLFVYTTYNEIEL